MINKEKMIDMYRKMTQTRILEERLQQLYTKGVTKGPIHLCIGQEAVGIGACAALRKNDYITSTHRGHAHYIGKGIELNKLVAEIFGKSTGYCKGKAGHMLVADISIGLIGGCGIVGGMLPIAVGEGLSIKMRGTDQVVVCFFGDGASNTGAFHEALNLAAIWKVPVIFLCENNCYGLTVPATKHLSVENVADRAKSYNIPGVIVDGNDVIAVYQIMSETVEKVRNGCGPILIEAKTYRLGGFSTGDLGGYQPSVEVETWKKKDPIPRFKSKMISENIITVGEVKKIEEEALEAVNEAIQFAMKSPYPNPTLETLFEDI
jgi:pyruvate dehydrogenase E1 component alpha subunit